MVREGIIGFGSHNNDMRLHENTGSIKTPTGWTFPIATDDSVTAASAFGGSRWIRRASGGAEWTNFGTSEAVTPKNNQWICLHVFRLSGTLDPAHRQKFFSFGSTGVGSGHFEWLYDTDSSHMKILFTEGSGTPPTIRGTSTNNFSTDINLDILGQFDGTRFKMWVNGALEIDIANTRKIDNTTAFLYRSVASGQEHYYGFGCITQSDSEADRPNTTVEMQELQSASDWATEQEYGDIDVCDSNDAVYTDVNLDGSDEIDETSAWCEIAANAGKQMSEMDDLPSGFTGTILGIYHHMAGEASASGKTVTTQARIHDGTSAEEKANANLSDVLANRQHFWIAPPGAANWEAVIKTSGSTLRAGVSSDAGNNDVEGWPGLTVEVYAVGDDPPPARRRVMAQVV